MSGTAGDINRLPSVLGRATGQGTVVTVSLAEGPNAPRLCVANVDGSIHQLGGAPFGSARYWEPRALESGVGALCDVWMEDGIAFVRTRDTPYDDPEPLVATVRLEGSEVVEDWKLPGCLSSWVASVHLARTLVSTVPSFDPPDVVELASGRRAGLFPLAWFAKRLGARPCLRHPWWLTVTDSQGQFLGSAELREVADDGIRRFSVRPSEWWEATEVWAHPDGRLWARVAGSCPPRTEQVTGRYRASGDDTDISPVLDALAHLAPADWQGMLDGAEG